MTMTNEEAIEQIKILKAFTGYDEDDPIVQRMQEALDMANKALEQTELSSSYNGVKSELEPSEDCISREDAIRIASINSMPVNECVRLIKELPSVKPQPIRGHWEDCSNGWMCSNCGRDVSYESDFCPHCGADMER